MRSSEKAKLSRMLNRLAIAAENEGCLTSIGDRLNDIISVFDLDAEMIYCGPRTPEYLRAIGKPLTGQGGSSG